MAKTLTSMVAVSIAEAGEAYRFAGLDVGKPEFAQLTQITQIDFKPVLTGPVVGVATIFVTATFTGFEIRTDNGKVARFTIMEPMRAALREMFNVRN